MAESLSSWLQAVRERIDYIPNWPWTADKTSVMVKDIDGKDAELLDAETMDLAEFIAHAPDDLTYAVSVIEAAQATISAASALQESAHHTDCQMEPKGKYRCDLRCNWNKFMKALTTWHRVVGAKDE